MIFTILRSLEQNPDVNKPLPPHGWRTQFWVIDQQYKVLVGPRDRAKIQHKARNEDTSDPVVMGKGPSNIKEK